MYFLCKVEYKRNSAKRSQNYITQVQVFTIKNQSRVSNIESNNSQNVGLEDYNNISEGIFPYFTTPSIKITLLGMSTGYPEISRD